MEEKLRDRKDQKGTSVLQGGKMEGKLRNRKDQKGKIWFARWENGGKIEG